MENKDDSTLINIADYEPQTIVFMEEFMKEFQACNLVW